MSIEAGVVIDNKGEPIFWHVPGDRTGGSLPDSSDLWTFLWEHREVISGFAHSHPGSGEPYYSSTDKSTFRAIEAGLGRRLDWWIVSSDSLVLYRWDEGKQTYLSCFRSWGKTAKHRRASEPAWARELRDYSHYEEVEDVDR